MTARGGLHRIEGIGLAVIASGLAVGPIDFDDFDPLPAKKSSEPHALRPSTFDPDFGHFAELLEPDEECLVAGRIGFERLGADESAQGVQCGSNVSVEVGVDTTRDPGRSFYDGHGRPYFP
jgi:hypothetical protein